MEWAKTTLISLQIIFKISVSEISTALSNSTINILVKNA
jgi:hypothetical protein